MYGMVLNCKWRQLSPLQVGAHLLLISLGVITIIVFVTRSNVGSSSTQTLHGRLSYYGELLLCICTGTPPPSHTHTHTCIHNVG